MKKIVIVTGGFDPIHSGHIKYFREAAQLGDELIVGLNSDAWLTRKKGAPFMSWEERRLILLELWMVTDVIAFDDSDGTAIDAIHKVKQQWPEYQVVFANGGDRTATNIPELVVPDVLFKFGVGGADKANSSSWILQEWKTPKTERPWGYYRVLHEVDGTKVKELTVMPGQQLSMQRHEHRSEYWMVTEGECKVEKEYASLFLRKHETMHVRVGEWHQLSNPFEVPCRLVEIQFGSMCNELDIERK